MAQHIYTDLPLEADSSDADSAFGGSNIDSLSYKTSITSSIWNYKYENGRRYHSYREGEYLIPNDDQEQDRMDLLHHVYRLLLKGELNCAPITKDPRRVLDLGTGTGIWAIDFADQFPESEVIGNDLSPIQPQWTPPNVTFEIDDFEAEWPFSRPFDYIHGRELAGSVKDFDALFAQAYKNLAPGGYFEMQSFRIEIFSDDGTLEKAPYTTQWTGLLKEASEKFGKLMTNMDEWPDKMTAAGFDDVTLRIIKVPMNPWPKDAKQKEIGRYMQVEQESAAPGYTNALLSRVLGWSKEEIDVLLARVVSELRDRSIHQYSKLYVIYGRKPST
ncbi:uncharacterized protein TRUGW13939_05350 [Talaromyces rugulosus]|uniref:Methyltransferase domain-containing protein n=1 Tax=Talaromyces rugulosus TaxID=121627 RepID=A0A7H8QW52_TALRU|nr:uncharacterized protein TRUGW13939_05350 [Talaromyces rugulosus]QKX58229.1 hypothetical protein TRUGW13939_05350 [Talaromyces rugulosus]